MKVLATAKVKDIRDLVSIYQTFKRSVHHCMSVKDCILQTSYDECAESIARRYST